MAAAAAPGGVVVHFGMPKTGSTSIRASLHRHLADPRFHYVDVGGPSASLAVTTAFKASAAGFHVHRARGTGAEEIERLRPEALARLAAELGRAGERTAIVSAEAIWSFSREEMEALRDAFLARRPSVRFAGYIRRPKELMESAFQQRVKAGKADFGVTNPLSRCRAAIEHMDGALHRDNVLVWLFDPKSFPGGDVVQDFCRRLGIAFDAAQVVRVNEGLSRPALALLYAYRKFGPGYGQGAGMLRQNRRLARQVAQLKGPKLRFHSEIVAPVMHRNRADQEWLERRLGGVSLAEDLTAGDAHAVRSEEELLQFTPESLEWLCGELGAEAPEPRRDMSAVEVARCMHLLRERLAREDPKARLRAKTAGQR